MWHDFRKISFDILLHNHLSHWSQDKMAAILETFWNAFSWMKIYEFHGKFHWSMFLMVWLILSQRWGWTGDEPLSVSVIAEFSDTFMCHSASVICNDWYPRNFIENVFNFDVSTVYSISQEICTRFCCALLCCGYAIVHNEFTWSIYPYSSGLLCWHWGNR